MEAAALDWSEESRPSPPARASGSPTPTSTSPGCATSAARPATGTALCRAARRDRLPCPTRERPRRRLADHPGRPRPLRRRGVRDILDLVPPVAGGAARRRPATAFRRLQYFQQRPDPLRREVSRRAHRRPGDRPRAQRQPRRPPPRRRRSATVTGAVFKAYAPGGRRLHRRRPAPTACAAAASRTPGCCSTSTARCPPASATRNDLVGRYFNDHPGTPRRSARSSSQRPRAAETPASSPRRGELRRDDGLGR